MSRIDRAAILLRFLFELDVVLLFLVLDHLLEQVRVLQLLLGLSRLRSWLDNLGLIHWHVSVRRFQIWLAGLLRNVVGF